jgi:flagellar basal body-associated protein FliL
MVQQAPAPAKKSSGPTILIIIIVVIIVLVCCACVGGSFLYFCGDLLTGAGGCGF